MIPIAMINLSPGSIKRFRERKTIAPPGFEPGSQASEARILDRCTMGLYKIDAVST